MSVSIWGNLPEILLLLIARLIPFGQITHVVRFESLYHLVLPQNMVWPGQCSLSTVSHENLAATFIWAPLHVMCLSSFSASEQFDCGVPQYSFLHVSST